MALNYLKDVQPREGEGITDADIAAAINADPSYFSDQPITVSKIASDLSAEGKDGAGIVARVMAAMDEAGATNRLVLNKMRIADAGGDIAVGNKLQRDMLRQLSSGNADLTSDVEDVLALATVPAYTEVEVTRSRVKHEADQYAGRVHEAIATERDKGDYTAQSIADAVALVEV